MKVLVLGASGIVGQHLRLCVPNGIQPVWIRHTPDPITRGVDLLADGQPEALLHEIGPDVIINLAGESNVDTVERTPDAFMRINVGLPVRLATWCASYGMRLIQISSQAVQKGDNAPYIADAVPSTDAVNQYGRQKALAEIECLVRDATILRLTFILGVRPLPHVGRQNPLEAMMAGQTPQVVNRWFSPLMAWHAAELIWSVVMNPTRETLQQFGVPERWNRYGIARLVNPHVEPCRHEDFVGIAPRPVDTTYTGSLPMGPLRGIGFTVNDVNDRAVELALFFGMTLEHAGGILAAGFGPLHNGVSDDFRCSNPVTDAELLDWYRRTPSYVWELSAYHDDPGFNYSGMCGGIAERLKAAGAKMVLCLGDGIGDLTLTLHRAGFTAIYHDLKGSRTAEYAAFRFWRQTGKSLNYDTTHNWDALREGFGEEPEFYDAICSLDFLEHVPNVEEWVRAIHAALVPGGLFCAQNAFACGSGPEGAMPMHLAVNDRFEKDWDPLLTAVGFTQLSSNWYQRKPKADDHQR